MGSKRRAWLFQSALMALALGFAGIVWLTYHPESALLDHASEWPVVGYWAQTLRDFYSPAKAPPGPGELSERSDPSSGSRRAPDPEVVVLVPDRPVNAPPFEWFVKGTKIYEAPDPAAPVIHTLEGYARLGFRERQGAWASVRFNETDGWVLVSPGNVSREPPLGRAPRPVVAIEGRPPDQRRLKRAQELLGPAARTLEAGPYPLATTVSDGNLLNLLRRVAGRHEESYRRRYGLPLVGQARGTVVLFPDEASYRRFQDEEEGIAGLQSSGHASAGIAALYTAGSGRPPTEVAATLVHELTHLVNRRAVGPALPPWLDEGLAGDLGGAQIRPDGLLEPGSWRGEAVREAALIRWTGALADLRLVEERRVAGRLLPLSRLLDLDSRTFVGDAGETPVRYAQSALFIRYLLDPDGDRRQPFQSFLGAVAKGASVQPEELLSRLGKSWQELDEGFHAWIAEQAASRLGLSEEIEEERKKATALRDELMGEGESRRRS